MRHLILVLSHLMTRTATMAKLVIVRVAALLIAIPRPSVLLGEDSALRLCEFIAQLGLRRVLLVTDSILHHLGLIDPLMARLKALKIEAHTFSGVKPDPTASVVNSGLSALRMAQSDAVLAVGGGSSIDAAKVIALAAANIRSPRAPARPRRSSGGYFGSSARCRGIPRLDPSAALCSAVPTTFVPQAASVQTPPGAMLASSARSDLRGTPPTSSTIPRGSHSRTMPPASPMCAPVSYRIGAAALIRSRCRTRACRSPPGSRGARSRRGLTRLRCNEARPCLRGDSPPANGTLA